MGYIGSDPVRNDSVSTAQLADNAVTNPKIVNDIVFTNVTASYFKGDGAGITGLTSAAIDSVAGMSNNYVLTATGASAITGESNLQFDGTGLAVTGAVTASYFKGDGSAISGVEVSDPNAVVFSIVFGG